ncbi:hypothetical protein INT43_004614 [Umbelopsis isabellina]|uniref:UspA domain-containing protein n=1 Tax=Mortierella isabellina TaxID=91625 RepID=A0A8H7U8G5_MORIS|nr:hypothetical protein INT43_004614 [Umbelopsis isabellina]
MVVAVDNTTASRKAMSHSLAMASMMSPPPELKVVYAIGLNPSHSLPIAFLDTLDRRNNMDIKENSRLEVEEITAWLAKFKEKYTACQLVTVQRHEPVGQIITQYLFDTRADLLMIGASSRSTASGTFRTLLGSTSEYCLRHAPCPVTIIKQTDVSSIQKH